MGLSHSRAHPRVTKVAPLQNKEEEPRSAGPVDVVFNQKLEEKSSYSFTRLQDRSKALEGQLPPLRETWYGRYSAVPRAMYFDIPLEQGETSIIKRHPPRRLQEIHRMQNFWNIKQGMTVVPGKLAKWKHGSVNKRPGDSCSGTAPALTQTRWGKLRRNRERW
uniref:Coiled-coil domain containing 198 n=1 Tax=Equus caballus TaxID=9796 RepID=A0A9L0RU55_HORSE